MKKIRNITDSDWEIISKYLNDETDSRERTEVLEWLSKSENNRLEMEKTRQMLLKIEGYYKSGQYDSALAWERVQSKIIPVQYEIRRHKKRRKEVIAQFYKYAAIIVIALLLGSIGYYFGFMNRIPAIYSEIFSANDQVLREYILPDGSLVALNSSSTLQFPKQFSGNIREVTISGEVFFDVKSNPEKPFIIHAGNAKIKVLGTSFNVCAYPGAETVEVVVQSGKVQVINENEDLQLNNREVFLTPGEKGTLFNESHVLQKSMNNDVNFLAWKTNDIIFNETPLSEVKSCLEKVYRISIQIADPELEDLVLTAHFDKKPIDFVLNVVQLTFDLNLEENNELFVLSKRNNE